MGLSVEKFFSVDNVDEANKVKITAIHLEGKALLWHQSFMKSYYVGQWPLWDAYKQAIQTRFGSTPLDDPYLN